MNTFLNEVRRKLGFHMIGGLFIALMLWLIPKFLFQIILIFILIISLILRSMRLHNVKIRIIQILVNKLGRKNEDGNGAIFFLLGVFLVTLLFNKNIATLSIIILSISDSLSTLVGKFLGKIKIYKKKTLEGTLSFLLSSFVILILSTHNLLISSVTSILSSLIELFTPIDDNIIIPYSCAFIISILLLI